MRLLSRSSLCRSVWPPPAPTERDPPSGRSVKQPASISAHRARGSQPFKAKLPQEDRPRTKIVLVTIASSTRFIELGTPQNINTRIASLAFNDDKHCILPGETHLIRPERLPRSLPEAFLRPRLVGTPPTMKGISGRYARWRNH